MLSTWLLRRYHGQILLFLMQHLRRDGGMQLSEQLGNGRCPAGLVSEQRGEGRAVGTQSQPYMYVIARATENS